MRIPSGVTDQYICSKCKQEKPAGAFSIDRHTARGRKYSCKDCLNTARRGRYQNDNRAAHLRRKYGLTPDDFDKMRQKQRGLCAICQQVPEARKGRGKVKTSSALHVDHDHVTGENRGLLCHNCNVAIGLMNDDPTRLARAIEYVRGLPVEYLPCA